jgi:hypothetical protein
MGLLQPDAPDLFVPDLSPPTGAAVDNDGFAACVSCRARFAVATMDIVGQGYRCVPCSGKASIAQLSTGRSDLAANLDGDDRHHMAAFGWQALAVGIAMMVIGLAVYIGLPRGAGTLRLAALGGAFSGFVAAVAGAARAYHARR